LWPDPTRCPGAFHHGQLHAADGDRPAAEAQRAGRLAGRWTEAASEFRKVVGRVQVLVGLTPVRLADQRIPVGDQVVNRAVAVTVRRTAIHAACRLTDRLVVWHDLLILPPVPDAFPGELLAGLFSREAEETGLIFHRATLTGYVLLSLGHTGDKFTRLSCGYTSHEPGDINELFYSQQVKDCLLQVIQ
jgi:hypothetical protein